jgi:glyoxylase-like metal-dependent hydrolase (beta-lactamase superfamily II)
MEIRRSEHSQFLSNSYLVADPETGDAFIVDGQGEDAELVEAAQELGVTPTHILLTHFHGDHVILDRFREAWGDLPVLASAQTAEQLGEGVVTERIEDGDEVEIGSLTVKALATPGHAAGHLALLVNGTDVFTADVLFKGTVGGTRAPGATGIDDLRASIMETLLSLDDDVVVHPGHREPTTIGQERAHNPFVRAWRGDDPLGDEAVKVGGEDATLLVWGPDYDGTNKAYVRFADGSEAVTGGSQVDRG